MSGPPPPPRRRKASNSNASSNASGSTKSVTPTISEEPTFPNKHYQNNSINRSSSGSIGGNVENGGELGVSSTAVRQGVSVAGSAYNAVIKQRNSIELSAENERTEVCMIH